MALSIGRRYWTQNLGIGINFDIDAKKLDEILKTAENSFDN